MPRHNWLTTAAAWGRSLTPLPLLAHLPPCPALEAGPAGPCPAPPSCSPWTLPTAPCSGSAPSTPPSLPLAPSPWHMPGAGAGCCWWMAAAGPPPQGPWGRVRDSVAGWQLPGSFSGGGEAGLAGERRKWWRACRRAAVGVAWAAGLGSKGWARSCRRAAAAWPAPAYWGHSLGMERLVRTRGRPGGPCAACTPCSWPMGSCAGGSALTWTGRVMLGWPGTPPPAWCMCCWHYSWRLWWLALASQPSTRGCDREPRRRKTTTWQCPGHLAS
ncbi:hypothetical protein V8C86DRAFT_2521899 [Haematococcus lacustris]